MRIAYRFGGKIAKRRREFFQSQFARYLLGDQRAARSVWGPAAEVAPPPVKYPRRAKLAEAANNKLRAENNLAV
jgi:hypothetical protein